MWITLLLCAFVGLTAADHGWKSGSEYLYNINGRTLTGIHQAIDQYSGLLIKGQLSVKPQADDKLTLEVRDVQYADVNRNMSGGWASQVDENQLQYTQFPIRNKVFQVQMKNGVIKKMIVEENTQPWELNFLKGIASQIQVDTQGENLKDSNSNLVPDKSNEIPMGVFKTMEDSVNGIYETIYDISPLSEHVLAAIPELAPLPHLRGDGQFIDVVKTKNFSNSDKHVIYHYGLNGYEGWNAGSSRMGNFLSRSSESRIILSGKLNRYTVQSSVTTDKVLLAPHIYNGQKGIVVSRMNLTLDSVNSAEGSVASIRNPREVMNLVYEYKTAPQANRKNNDEQSSSSSSSSSSESGSSSSAEGNGRSSMESQENSSSSSSSSSSSDSSSSSSEEYLQENPQSIDNAPILELQPDSMSSENLVDEIQRVIREINQASEPNSKLSYFTLLTRLVSFAKSQQLQQLSDILYHKQNDDQQSNSQDEVQKSNSWMTYRDAVAQAGTGPALVAIRYWIDSGKVRGGEAAQLLASLPNSARYPNLEYMNYFFKMVTSDIVQNQRFLNSSAIFAFTDLVRKSQVDSMVSQKRYAVNLSDGKREHRQVVENEYIPYLQKQLEKAISQGDSIKAQTYIRALGNTAHPRIMAVYEPYLEGRKQISDFQRLSMIASMDEMTRTNPKFVRNVLYRMYQNTADVPEIRVASVMQLMKTNPPAQMLQRMAEFTNYDHSEQVNAAVKSAIESAADSTENSGLTSQIGINARAAANLLNTNRYGGQYSKHYIRSYIVKQQDLEYKHDLSIIQGKDSIIPSSIMYNAYPRIGGFDRTPFTAQYMTSSVDELLSLLSEKSQSQSSNKVHKRENKGAYSFEDILKMVNVKRDEPVQVEGNLLFSIFGGKRFFTYDNDVVERLPEIFRSMNDELKKGTNLQLTKYYNQHSLEIGFPLAMGVPFIYSLDTPSHVSVSGNWKGHVQYQPEEQQSNGEYSLPINGEISGDIRYTYSSQTNGKMGFTAPFNQKKYISGLEKNFHTHLPVQGKVEYNPKENKAQLTLRPNEEENDAPQIFQWSTNMYTTVHDNKHVKPYLQGENAQLAYAKPPRWLHKTVGRDETGYAFDVSASTEGGVMNMRSIYEALRRHDYVSALLYFDKQQDIQNENYSVRYNPQKSDPKPVKFSVTFASDHNEGNQQSSARIYWGKPNPKVRTNSKSTDNLAEPEDYEQRVREFLRTAQSGIKDAKSHALDVSVNFGDSEEAGYSVTLGHARSPVTQKGRVLMYYRGKPMRTTEETKPFETAFQLNINDPQVPHFNFREALKANSPAELEGRIHMGEHLSDAAQVSFQGKLQRSQERREYLNGDPASKACEEQMKRGNNIQPACTNQTFQANLLNEYDFTFNYQNVPAAALRRINGLYSMARHAFYGNNEENTSQRQRQNGIVNVGVRFSPDLKQVNVTVDAPTLSSNFTNVMVHRYAIPLFVYHPRYNPAQMLYRRIVYSQPQATAVLDGNYVTTFNNNSYPIDLGNCYHVFAMYAEPQRRNQREGDSRNNEERFAVLVKDKDSQNRDVQVILDGATFELKKSGSSGYSVRANEKDIPVSENNVAKWSDNKNYLEAYAHPSGPMVLSLPKQNMEVHFDGSRLEINMKDSYRSKIRGLAGTFDGEPVNDFTTPKNRVIKNPLLFASTYAVVDSECHGPAKDRKERAEKTNSYEKTTIFGNVITDREAGRHLEKIKRDDSKEFLPFKQIKDSCAQSRTKIWSQSGKTCFSIKPVTVCGPECKPKSVTPKEMDFHCLEKSKSTMHWEELIKKGANPDFSKKTVNARLTISHPNGCEPKA